jgi:hypothetical protein
MNKVMIVSIDGSMFSSNRRQYGASRRYFCSIQQVVDISFIAPLNIGRIEIHGKLLEKIKMLDADDLSQKSAVSRHEPLYNKRSSPETGCF